MIRLGDHYVTSNLAPCSDPKLGKAVMEFYIELAKGNAVQRVDKNAPPLAIEREGDGK